MEIEHDTSGITKPALTRLARRAGVKSMSDECLVTLRNLITVKLKEVLYVTSIINEQNNTKTIMNVDLYEALRISGVNINKI